MLILFLKKEQRQTGSIIKSLDKETEWTIQINKSIYTITFCFSEVDNWKILKINQLQMYKQKIPKEQIQHAFIIENIDFFVKYDKVTKAFLLLVFGNPIESYTVEASLSQKQQEELNQKQQSNQNVIIGQQQQEKIISQQQKQLQMNNIKELEQRIDRSLPIMGQLVELFKDVIDHCSSNEDVINSQELKKMKEDILVDQGKLTNVLNQEICEASTDKVLKMIDKQVQSTNRFDDICSRKIILSKKQQPSQYELIQSKIEQYNNDKKKPYEKGNDILIIPFEDDNENNDYKDYNSKQVIQQKQESNPPWVGANKQAQGYNQPQQQQQQNYNYPMQPESQILFYQQKNVQNQQQFQSNNQYGDNNNKQQQQSQNDKDASSKAQASELNKDDNLCIICMDKPSTHTLVPCGHKKYCQECAELMVKKNQCAFCRNPASQCLRIFE